MADSGCAITYRSVYLLDTFIYLPYYLIDLCTSFLESIHAVLNITHTVPILFSNFDKSIIVRYDLLCHIFTHGCTLHGKPFYRLQSLTADLINLFH